MAVQATAVWRIRAGGSDTNGGGYDSGIAGAGTDYSQQDAAQINVADAVVNNTTTVTSATASFAAAHIGNAIYLTGGGATTGWYFVTAVASPTSITVDRATGGAGAGGTTLRLGGAWAGPQGTPMTTSGPLVQGNTVYIRGAGTDNPTTADYTLGGSYITMPSGGTTGGWIRVIGENGRPLLANASSLSYHNCNMVAFENLKFKATGTTNAGYGCITSSSGGVVAVNVSFDQAGNDVAGFGYSGTYQILLLGCEVYSSTGGTGGSQYAISTGTYGSIIAGCHVNAPKGKGVLIQQDMSGLYNSVISKCGNDSVTITNAAQGYGTRVIGNTIDGGAGHGIVITTAAGLASLTILSNIISNHTGVGKYGITVSVGSLALNDRTRVFVDGNWFYNNTAHRNLLSAGPNDTDDTDPGFTDQANGDYTPTSSAAIIAQGLTSVFDGGVPGATPAWMTTLTDKFLRRGTTPDVISYGDAGAVQRVMAAAGGNSVAVPINGRLAP